MRPRWGATKRPAGWIAEAELVGRISSGGDRGHSGLAWDAVSASARQRPWSLRDGRCYAWTSRHVHARSIRGTCEVYPASGT